MELVVALDHDHCLCGIKLFVMWLSICCNLNDSHSHGNIHHLTIQWLFTQRMQNCFIHMNENPRNGSEWRAAPHSRHLSTTQRTGILDTHIHTICGQKVGTLINFRRTYSPWFPILTDGLLQPYFKDLFIALCTYLSF